MIDLILSDYNILLISSSVIIDATHRDTIKFCIDIGLECEFRKKDIKNLYYNFFIYNLCEIIRHNNTKYRVVIYHDTSITVESHDLYMVNKISNILPVSVINNELDIYIFYKLAINKDAESIVILDKLKKPDALNLNLQKLKRFLKTNNLKFLNDTYFKSIQTKMALYT
jgi:hypothetical protein